MITLYAIPVSTSCARTRIVLDHKRLPYTEVPPPNGYGSSSYKDIIPAGTVPGLSIDEFSLSDSAAQVELLEDLHPEIPMLPKNPKDRARIRSAASFHDTRLEPSVRALFGQVKPKIKQDKTSIEQNVSIFQERLNLLTNVVKPNPFLAGDLFSHADAAFPTTIYMGIDISSVLGIQIQLPNNIATWLSQMSQIPAVKQTLELNRQAVADWVKTKI